jgi:hypothetical protein
MSSSLLFLQRKASLLYDSIQASDLSVVDLYNAAINGFNQILHLQPQMKRFESTLFDITMANSHSADREVRK